MRCEVCHGEDSLVDLTCTSSGKYIAQQTLYSFKLEQHAASIFTIQDSGKNDHPTS